MKNNIIYIIIAVLVVIIVYSLLRDRVNNTNIEFPEPSQSEEQIDNSVEQEAENNEEVEEPVEQTDGQETVENTNSEETIQVFFTNQQNIEEGQDCAEVQAQERNIGKTESIGTATLNELLKGPTQNEAEEGFITSIPKGTQLNNLSITNGVAVADFNEALNKDVAGSCLVQNIRAQITQTLLQFPTVNSVVISVNGDSETILQP